MDRAFWDEKHATPGLEWLSGSDPEHVLRMHKIEPQPCTATSTGA